MSTGPELEVLEHNAGRWRPSRIAKIGLVALTLIFVVCLVIDREAKQREALGLDACAQRAHGALMRSSASVSSMANYVRVTRASATSALAAELEAMVSERAANSLPGLIDVSTECQLVGVTWHHWGLRDRKLACLDRLAEGTRALREVSRDGAAYFRVGLATVPDPIC